MVTEMKHEPESKRAADSPPVTLSRDYVRKDKSVLYCLTQLWKPLRSDPDKRDPVYLNQDEESRDSDQLENSVSSDVCYLNSELGSTPETIEELKASDSRLLESGKTGEPSKYDSTYCGSNTTPKSHKGENP